MNREIEEFKIYTKPYIQISDSCTLKIDHTFRVMDLCERIAKSLKLSNEDIYLAKLCGLLHDIGRFEQWRNYGTFSDKDSVDHGDLGIEVLTTNNLIRKFIYNDKYDNIITSSILFHNKYDVPNELTDREKLFCNIVRDADKIDIIYLYTIGHITVETNNTCFSDKIYDCLINKKLISRYDKKTEADVLSISLGFVFDINFKESFKILRDFDYLNKEIDIYINKTSNPLFIKQLSCVKNIITDYIDNKSL